MNYITLLQRKTKHTCTNYTSADVSGVRPRSVDITINELKDSLNEIEGINNLLLRREPTTERKNYNN